MAQYNLGAALASYKENNEVTLLESGEYTLEVVSATAGTAAKGPTIMPVFKVYAGPLKGKRVLAGKISFSENSLFRTIPQLKGFGITDEFLQQANSQADPIKTIAEMMVGRVADVKLNIEPWQGEDRNKIVSVRAPESLHAASAPQAPQTPQASQVSSDRAPTF